MSPHAPPWRERLITLGVALTACILITAARHRPIAAKPEDARWVMSVARRCKDVASYVSNITQDGVTTDMEVREIRNYVAATIKNPWPGHDCKLTDPDHIEEHHDLG